MRLAAAEMVVVGSQNDIFVGFAGEVGEDVADGGVETLDVDPYCEIQGKGGV